MSRRKLSKADYKALNRGTPIEAARSDWPQWRAA
jgi:hypothetical protein